MGLLTNDLGVKITEISTESDYRTDRKAKYLYVQIVQLVYEKLNLTTIFRPPSTDFSFESYMK